MKPKRDMKKSKLVVLILLLAIIVMCSFSPLHAQDKSGVSNPAGRSFDSDSKLLNVGIGLGGVNYYNNGWGRSYHRSPAFSLTYEQALPDKVGPGYLGLGGYLGFQNAFYRYNYTYNDYYYRHSWNYWLLAARAAYHLDVLNWEKGEIYFGAIIGLRIQTYHYSSNSPDKDLHRLNDRSIYPTGSLLAGGRYYLTNKVAAFMEAGYGISFLTLGVTFKL
jgi:hypothetical protein